MISVIIVTYNAAGIILPCIASILAQCGKEGGGREIIIVDNASTDGTAPLIRSTYPGVKIIQNESNRGFAAAVNQGSVPAGGDILLLLNPDTVLEPGLFIAVEQFFTQHPDAIGCGMRMLNMDGTAQPSVWNFPGFGSLLLEMFLPYALSSKLLGMSPATCGRVESVSGGAMAVRTGLYHALHGLDERYFMYYEDIDFCLRAKKAGYSIYFFPGAVLRHQQGASSWKAPVLFFTRYYSSKLRYFRKHVSAPMYPAFLLIVLIGLCWKIVAYGIAGCLLFRRSLLRLAGAYAETLPAVVRNSSEF